MHEIGDDLLKRFDRLDQTTERLSKENRRLRRWNTLLVLIALVLAFRGVYGITRLHAQEKPKGNIADPPPPGFFSQPPPLEPVPIYPHLGTKGIDTEWLTLRDEKGHCFATLTSHTGAPALCLNAANQTQRLWITVNKQGDPSLMFFDRDGKNPVEMTVTQDDEPRLKLRRITLPPPTPIGPPVAPAEP